MKETKSLQKFNDLATNSACRRSGLYSVHLLLPSEFQRTFHHSRFVPPWSHRDSHSRWPEPFIVQRLLILCSTSPSASSPLSVFKSRTTMSASILLSQRSNTNMLTSDSNSNVFSVRVCTCTMQLPRPACLTWLATSARLCLVARLLQVKVRHRTLTTLHCTGVPFSCQRNLASTGYCSEILSWSWLPESET